VVGSHQGLAFHTLGQRSGLGIGGVRGRPEAPWYVVGKDPRHEALWVDQDHDSPALMARRLRAAQAHWVAGAPPAVRFAATAKVRYRQADQRCEVEVADDGTLTVRFEAPQRAVTPGQSVVFYDGETCLGGATIEATDAAWGGLLPPPALPRRAPGAAA
jgi:tRNA-specific 2-thiouridylase